MKLISTIEEALRVTEVTTGKQNRQMAKAIMAAISRNKREQNDLFSPALTEFVHYVECPLTGMRKEVLKDEHFKKLGFTDKAAALVMFPGLQTSATNTVDSKKATMTIVEADGTSKRDKAELKRQKTRKEVNEDGFTIDDIAGKKAAHERMHGLDAYTVPKSVSGRSSLRNKQVVMLSQEQSTSLLERYTAFANWLSVRVKSKNKVPGKVTHTCVSITTGFNHGISPWVIAHNCNFTDIGYGKTLVELFLGSEIPQEQSAVEFDNLMALWSKELLSGTPHNSEETFRYYKDNFDSTKEYYL